MLTQKEINDWYDLPEDNDISIDGNANPYLIYTKYALKQMPEFWQQQFKFLMKVAKSYGVKPIGMNEII